MKDKLPEIAKKKSQRVLKSGKQVEISLVEGSFRRIAGVREEADFSGSFILRTVEIRREPGQSLGFYIREGDGWLRRDGVFISRVNLGSMVEVNGLLHVGDEVLKVNNVDVSSLSLDDVVLIMTVVRKLVLTIKVLTSVSLTRTLSARMPRRKAATIASSSTRALPSRPISMCYAERIASKESDDVLLREEVKSDKIENPYEEIGFGLPQISASLNLAQPLSCMTDFSSNTRSSNKHGEEIEMSPLQLQTQREPTVVPSSPSPPLAASTPVLPHKLQNSAQVEVHVDVEPATESPKEKIKQINALLHLRPPGLGLLAAVTRKQDSKDSDLEEKDDVPPPVPPTPPPQDGYEEEEMSLQNEERVSSAVEVSEEADKTGVEEPDKSKDDHTCSGVLVVTIRSLNVDGQAEKGGPTIDRVEFQMMVDSVLRVSCVLDPANLGDVESRTFAADILQNQQISITLKSDHFCKSRQVTLFTPATEDSTRKFLLPFKLDNFGRAKINLEYRPMQIAVPRMDPNGYLDGATFKDFVETNPNNSKLPLVVETCINIIEKYGLQEPNLYHLCSSEAARDEAFKVSLSQTKSEQDIEEIVARISVHAFTGVLKDFFCKLPEPFFTSRLSTSLTEVASMENAPQLGENFMKKFTDCLPEETIPTYELLLEHFRHVCSHSSENGMTVENLARTFGPLLLTPSINSQDLNTSATTETYADDYKSQARVIAILINSEADELPSIYKV